MKGDPGDPSLLPAREVPEDFQYVSDTNPWRLETPEAILGFLEEDRVWREEQDRLLAEKAARNPSS